MFIKEIEDKKPDMTEYNLNGINDGLNYVENCEDVRVYKKVFEALH